MRKRFSAAIIALVCIFAMMSDGAILTYQAEQKKIQVGFFAQSQNLLTHIFGAHYDCFLVNITVIVLNLGKDTYLGGKLRVHATAPTGWYYWKEIVVPQLKGGGSYSNFIDFKPEATGEWKLTVSELYEGSSSMVYEGGFMALNIKSGTDFWVSVGVLAALVTAAVGVIGLSRRKKTTIVRSYRRRTKR